MDKDLIKSTIQSIEDTKKIILAKLSENINLKEKLEMINNLKEIDNNLLYYDQLIKSIGKIKYINIYKYF